MDYGFTLKVVDLTSSQMKQIEQSVKNLGGTVQSETSNIQDNFNKLGNAANDLKNAFIEAFAIREIYEFGKELLNVTAEFQGFENVIRGSSGGIVDGQQDLDYLSNAITRLHLPMKQAYQGFSEMEAGFYGTTIQGEKLRKVFEGLSEISLTKHLTPDLFSRAIYDMKEVGELGTLQQKQLRMLSMVIPGAGKMAAEAMHMSSQQLHEAMKKGQVNADVFLPKFAEVMKKVAEPGLSIAGDSLLAQINDEKNSITKLMLDMGDSLQPLFLDILSTVREAMEGIKSVWNTLSGNSSFVNALKSIFDWAVKLVPIWAAYEIIMKGIAVTTDLFIETHETLVTLLGTEAIAAEDATIAWEAFNAALETTIIGGAVVTLGLMVDHFVQMNKELNGIIDKKFKLSENNNFFNSQKAIATRIQEQAKVLNKLSPEAKQNLSNDIKRNELMLRDSLPVVKLRDSILQDDASIQHPRTRWDRFMHGVGIPALWTNDGGQRVVDSAATSKLHLYELGESTKGLHSLSDVLKNKYKIKPDLRIEHPLDGAKTDAINTSNLSGASGGLGQAKIIHINIGTFQKNEGVRESKSQADSAIEKLTELINGFSDSQNAM